MEPYTGANTSWSNSKPFKAALALAPNTLKGWVSVRVLGYFVTKANVVLASVFNIHALPTPGVLIGTHSILLVLFCVVFMYPFSGPAVRGAIVLWYRFYRARATWVAACANRSSAGVLGCG